MEVIIDGIRHVPELTRDRTFAGMTLAQALASLRTESLDLVAREAGVSKVCLYEIESGRTENPSFFTVVKVADYYGVSLDALAMVQCKMSIARGALA